MYEHQPFTPVTGTVDRIAPTPDCWMLIELVGFDRFFRPFFSPLGQQI